VWRAIQRVDDRPRRQIDDEYRRSSRAGFCARLLPVMTDEGIAPIQINEELVRIFPKVDPRLKCTGPQIHEGQSTVTLFDKHKYGITAH
jgi:hypothetical protein